MIKLIIIIIVVVARSKPLHVYHHRCHLTHPSSHPYRYLFSISHQISRALKLHHVNANTCC